MKAHRVTLFTNGNTKITDKNDEQISDYQRLINCYSVDKVAAKQCTIEANEFYISDFGNWAHRISRPHMQALLGVLRHDQ